MKFLKALLIGAILSVPFVSKAHADNDTESTLRDKTVVVHSTITVAANTSTATLVISLSSNAAVVAGGWPHYDNGGIDITGIVVEMDKVAASTMTLRFGVVTFVNTSTGSVTWFYNMNQTKNASNSSSDHYFQSENAGIRCKVIPVVNGTGTTPYIVSSEKTAGSTTYQTDVNLISPIGFTAPGRGDIVLEIINNDFTQSVNVDYTILYHSHK